jgi:Ca2+-binding RTX toxin-like protein
VPGGGAVRQAILNHAAHGGGNDTVQLGSQSSNLVSIANAETIVGGSNNDTITITSGAATVSGGGGINSITATTAADTFVFDQNSANNFTKLMNFDGTNDHIALDTNNSQTFGGNTYVLGGALANNGNITSVADADTRLTTALSTGNKGGFVYQQDTGELYYSGTGDFHSGGTLVGVVTTNGTTPWTYAFSAFREV